MTGVWVHHELGVRQVLGQDEGVHRRDDNVLVPMHDQSGLADPRQHRIAVCRGNGAPFADRLHLSACRRLGDWRIAVPGAKVEPFNIGSPRGLAGLAGREERPHEQGDRIAQLLDRKFGEGHAFSAPRSRAQQDHPPNHVPMILRQLLGDHTAERESHDVEAHKIERPAKNRHSP